MWNAALGLTQMSIEKHEKSCKNTKQLAAVAGTAKLPKVLFPFEQPTTVKCCNSGQFKLFKDLANFAHIQLSCKLKHAAFAANQFFCMPNYKINMRRMLSNNTSLSNTQLSMFVYQRCQPPVPLSALGNCNISDCYAC